MRVFLYIERVSRLHSLHPVVKLIGMIILFAAAFACERPLAVVPLLAGVAVGLTVAQAWGNIYRLRLLFVMIFVMTLIIWTLFFRGGVPLVSWWRIQISLAGMSFALAMACKLVTFLAVGTLFLSTTTIEEFAYALTRFGFPYRLGFTMTLAFRLVPVFVDAATTVVQAQRCRGFNFDEGSLVQRMRRYVPVLVPVFMIALRRADGMAMALEMRGFQSGRERTVMVERRIRLADSLVILLLMAVGYFYFSLWMGGMLSAAR